MKLINIVKRIVFRLRGEYITEDLIDMGLVVGQNFKRMHGVILDPSHVWHIHIGDNVTLAPRVHVLAHDASLYNTLGYTRIGNVNIGNNVFIGAESVILPGVKIGNNVIVGANSTVSRDIPSDVVVAGNPAKIICSMSDFIKRNEDLMKKRPCFDEKHTLRGKITPEVKKMMYDELKNGYGFVK